MQQQWKISTPKNKLIKSNFYPKFLMKIILTVINCVCACVRTSAEVTFQGRVWAVSLMILFESFCFGLSDITLFHVILGLLGINIISML